MKALIRTWTRHGGERSAQDRQVIAERLRIGRSTDQEIQIPDLRVGLTHAEIVSDARRERFTAQTRNTPTLWVNGEPVQRRVLEIGDRIDCGRFSLTFVRPQEGYDVQIDIEERLSAREEKSQRLSRLSTTLSSAGLSRRWLSWALFIVVLATTLGAPAWYRFGTPHDSGKPLPVYAWPRDTAWSPGPLSPAHALFQNDCSKCHQKAFEPVRNEACLSCHQKVHEHVGDPRWTSMPKFAQSRCEDCHVEHSGQTLVDTHNQACTQCHADPQKQFPGLKLEAVDSFSRNHPVFKAQVSRFDGRSGKFNWIGIKQTDPVELHNDTNFIFPHDKHLDAHGIKSPTGNRVLKCADCHEATADGISFKPVSMEKHCAECHRLDFDPDNPDAVLPHGNPPLVGQTIRDYYARKALEGGVTKPGAPEIVQLRRKPGEQLSKPQAEIALAWANQQSDLVIDEVFDKRICGYCHLVQKTADTVMPFRIAPVMLQDHGKVFTSSAFSHADHATEKCSSCHQAARSNHSEQVLMPDITRCRYCHADVAGNNKVASRCHECHRYHMDDKPLMDKTAHIEPRETTESEP
jgi:predicted CXXCH cytochrome family protein